MSDEAKNTPEFPMSHGHAHPNGRRCCGRLLHEKCSPDEEASKLNPITGEKSCCKGHHGHHHGHGHGAQES